ncbi:hypothetical protein EDEG_00610 [Edhazardia aedis USNM 41457]|uniref:Alternative oxidase n=1 Tax=Edhazardia aedis (strain USNM 41457) TaxID=1003232 RepID=J9DRY8_EDHAE|nr:hypothetical protein EDEG_00610 [Edhazardia aedis USNM 41457]|eukprot:EJW05340.1 hypothetical protein EDEG_00610 [Edhazardia aedis USNM 41457]
MLLDNIPSNQIKNNFERNTLKHIIPTKSILLPSFSKPKCYVPLPVRKEFENPISLAKIQQIDYRKGYHFKPITLTDKFAHSTVKFLRSFADFYFKKDYNKRAVALETVAAIPGMIGGLYRHLYSLRSLKDNGEKISKLLKEAENERQHLLAFLAIKKPSIIDKILIHAVQPLFFSFYFMLYGFMPKTAHRFVGYLEEEAIRSYDMYEEEILKGNIKNVDISEGAKSYWKMPDNAKLLDLVRAVRADEAAHRDANHEFANEKPFKLA